MSVERVIIRCTWRSSGPNIGSRLEAIATALEAPAVRGVIGPRWFHTAGSRARALRSPMSLGDLRSPEHWARRRRLPHQPYLSVDLWNGKDGLEGMKLDVSVQLFDGEPDMAVIAPFRVSVDADDTAWRSLHDAARALANTLCGAALLTSRELMRRAETAGCRLPLSVGYGFYFGPSNSMLPCFEHLQAAGISAPTEFVIAEPGAELGQAELARLDEVAASAGLW